MKKCNQLLLVIFCTPFIMMFNGCGKDGSDGLAYLKFDWDQYVFGYWDNNPGVPSTIRKNTDYRVMPKTYDFEYYCTDDVDVWGYEGTYTIRINEGKEGSWFTDGDDGKDRYHSFYLSGSGGQFSFVDKSMPANLKIRNELGKNYMYGFSYDRKYVGEIIHLIFYTENAIIFVEKQKFVIE